MKGEYKLKIISWVATKPLSKKIAPKIASSESDKIDGFEVTEFLNSLFPTNKYFERFNLIAILYKASWLTSLDLITESSPSLELENFS